MIRFFKKGIAWIITGSFTMILAACYGTESAYTYYKYMKTNNSNGDPIPGLKVDHYENDQLHSTVSTDAEGGFEVPIIEGEGHKYKLIITDIDSTENLGHFKTTTIDLDTLNGDIVLEEIE